MSYYKAMMNAALNADNNKIPIDSWFDVEKSNYNVLVWFGSTGHWYWEVGFHLTKSANAATMLVIFITLLGIILAQF